MTSEDRIALVLHAIELIDIVPHPVWEVIKNLYRYPALGNEGGIYAERENVSLCTDRFQVFADLGLTWICACHEATLPDVESLVIEGRFDGGRAIVETIAVYRPID